MFIWTWWSLLVPGPYCPETANGGLHLICAGWPQARCRKGASTHWTKNLLSWLPLLSWDPQIEGAGQRFRHDCWLLLLMIVEVLSPGSQDVCDR